MNQKIIFLDIDGTLTEPGRNVPPPSAVEAIQKARERGHLVFLCTGRNLSMLEPLLTYEFDGFIASSGGYITVGEDVIYDCPMEETAQIFVMQTLKECGFYRTIECLDGAYVDQELNELLRANPQVPGNSEFLRMREQIEESLQMRPMTEYDGRPGYKVVFMMPDGADLQNARRLLEKDYQIVMQDRNPIGITNGEVVSRKFDKGFGIRLVCEALGVSVHDTVAYGDSMNDREMMETAGLSICMENGNPALKTIADEICPAVGENGIYHSFLRHGLMK